MSDINIDAVEASIKRHPFCNYGTLQYWFAAFRSERACALVLTLAELIDAKRVGMIIFDGTPTTYYWLESSRQEAA